MTQISDADLVAEIERAAGAALRDLFETGEDFHYCALITTGEALAPCLVAWSRQALDRYADERGCSEEEKRLLEWSYAESPYLDCGREYFERTRSLFLQRPEMNDDTWEVEYEARLGAMEKALCNLDERGVLGEGERRLSIVINVEVMPPDSGNMLRALRLNPRAALSAWLANTAEAIPE